MLTGGVVRGRAKSRQSPLTHIHRKVGRFLSKFQNRQAQFQKRVLLNSKTWKKRWTLGIHRKVGRFFGKSHNTWGLSFSKWLWKRSIVKYGVFFKNLNCPTRGPEIALSQGVAVTQCTKKLLSCPLCADSHSQEKTHDGLPPTPPSSTWMLHKKQPVEVSLPPSWSFGAIGRSWVCQSPPQVGPGWPQVGFIDALVGLKFAKVECTLNLNKKWGPPQLFLKPPACPELTKAGPKLVLVDYDLSLYWQ